MPSHKHKKKKKSHKQKKYITSSSEDEGRPWKVKLSSSDSEDSANEERLTSLVRKSYLNHLQQALSQNFKNWYKNTEELPECLVQELVNKWSLVLEQKAIRACMMSELYRRNMVSSIKEIKASTNEERLYIDDISMSSLKSKIPLDKNIQTEKFGSEVETQTQAPISSLLELPLPVSPSSRPYDPAIEFSSTVSSTIPQSSDVCNITSTSDFCDPAQILFNIVKSTDKRNIVGSIDKHRDCYDNSTEQKLDYENCFEDNVFQKSKSSYRNLKTCDPTLVPLKGQIVEGCHKPSSGDNLKDNLDSRLTAMGLLGAIDIETERAIAELANEKSKKNNWFAEEIAQSCNFTRSFLRLSTQQRKRVNIKIEKLFGNENNPLTELTEKNITICRKRIASVVVMELTPIYQAKKIASRHLFKFLAKKITKSLMDNSYAPDTKNIRWKVKEFFSDGKVIMSESDCV
uniref:Set2 Rpb1 interacting domain-containing protein n=1 Tax=Homalodisca liturata TaxID=320908 RepID=A0A1B6IJH8_9HEMI